MSATTDTILAIDLGRYKSVACIYARATREHTFRTLDTTPAPLDKLLARHPGAVVVIEACANAGWVHDHALAAGHPVQVANTAAESWKFTHLKRKTDHDDALKLARLAAVGEIEGVPVPPRAIRQWKSLIGFRKRLVGERVRCQNRIRGLLVCQGLPAPMGAKAWSAAGLAGIGQFAQPLAECGPDDLWRGVLYGHIHTVRRQLNLTPVGSDVNYKSKRDAVAADIPDVHSRRGVEARLNRLGPLDTEIRRLERDIEVAAEEHYPAELAVLQTITGVGPIISLTILLEIDTVTRFNTRQQFCSYARLITPRQESGSKILGMGNAKSGNAWLKWAFSEAAVLSAQKDERMKKCLAKLQSRHGSGKGLSILAHKLGRVVYHLLRTKKVFDVERFVRG